MVRLHSRNVIIDVIWRIFFFPALKSRSTKYCIVQSDQHTSCGNFVLAAEIPPVVHFLPLDDYAPCGMVIATTLYCLDGRIPVPPV